MITLSRLYDDHARAAEVVRELERAGVPASDISIVSSNADHWYSASSSQAGTQLRSGRVDRDADGVDDRAEGAAGGAGIGAGVGGAVGLLAGLGMMAIPGIGPVVAAGWLASTAAGAVAGGATGGIIGALTQSGVSDDDAHVYAEGVRRGGTLVSVRIAESGRARIEGILDRSAVDIRQRAATYRQSGWTRFDPNAAAYTADQLRSQRKLNSSRSAGTTPRTVTAYFDTREHAKAAMQRLESAGIPAQSISLIEGTNPSTQPTTSKETPGFWDSLADLFLPEEDHSTYAEGLRRGGYVVTVRTDDSHYQRAIEILDADGTIDLEDRAASWRKEGWSATRPSAGTTVNTTARRGSEAGEQVIPITEEQLRVGKRDVSHGRVRIRSYVVETPVQEDVNLREEHVRVERRPVDRPAGIGDDAFRERTLIAEERAEEAVVQKKARVKEELVLKKDVRERSETVSDNVRRTEVKVEDERNSTLRSGQQRRP